MFSLVYGAYPPSNTETFTQWWCDACRAPASKSWPLTKIHQTFCCLTAKCLDVPWVQFSPRHVKCGQNGLIPGYTFLGESTSLWKDKRHLRLFQQTSGLPPWTAIILFSGQFSGGCDILSITVSEVGGGRLLSRLESAVVGTSSAMDCRPNT